MTGPRSPISRARAARALTLLALVLVAASVAVPSATAAPRARVAAAPRAGGSGTSATPTSPISHNGRWLTDADGRVVLLHGVNMVAKGSQTPAERGFGDDDATWLADNGFDVVRLGFSPDALMPTPGVVNTAYVDSFVQTADILRSHGLLVLVDLHQDGWGPETSGNGFPAWMTLTHGATNTHTGFPLYYITNPAIQAAFTSFWNNEAGPGGVALQSQVAAIFSAFANKLAANPNIIGYDLINEPFPGSNWNPCLQQADGCPAQDHSSLDPYYARMQAAIRAQDPTHLVFGEPFVLFNFGQSLTHITSPGGDANGGMSFHMYAAPEKEPNVVKNAITWAGQTGGALLNSEFGATNDPKAIDRQVQELDNALIPWIWWSYDENINQHLDQPMSDANGNAGAIATLVRPHAVAVAGTPTSFHYDLTSRVMKFGYATTGPGGRTYPADTVTSFQVAPRTYPKGYKVRVTGGHVTSADNAAQLTVVADAGASSVTVTVWAAENPAPPIDTPATTTTTPGPTTTTVATEPANPAVPVAANPTFTG